MRDLSPPLSVKLSPNCPKNPPEPLQLSSIAQIKYIILSLIIPSNLKKKPTFEQIQIYSKKHLLNQPFPSIPQYGTR